MDQSDSSPFGNVLRRFRERASLTQEQAAVRIGVSRDTISLWERGLYRPETPTMVHELARILNLTGQEKRLLFEAYAGLASIPPLHNLPTERNPYFVGRDEPLRYLHKCLATGTPVALTQAISGLGGIGKTQMALEYAYRYRDSYRDILWVTADSHETLVTSYVRLAALLDLREKEERDQTRVVEAVKQWLRRHKEWLLILDNIEDLNLIRAFVPTAHQGVVVLTTRRQVTGPVAQVVELDIMPEEEGVLFLLRRARYIALNALLADVSPHDEETARIIVRQLAGLPLALDQAGAYIEETHCSLSQYLQYYRVCRTALLQRRGVLVPDHPEPVITTWSLSFRKIEQANPVAADLLRVCAFLYPDAIPEEIITEGAGHLGPFLLLVKDDPLVFNEAIAALRVYSLVRRDAKDHVLSIHRLVQAVLKDSMEESIQLDWILRIVRAVNATFPEVEFTTWQQCERCLPHALACAMLVEQQELMLLEAACLLDHIGQYLCTRARYSEAERLFLRALVIREQQLGSGHLQTAQSLTSLAECYRELGKYEQAEPLYLRALTIDEKTLGPQHPEVGIDLNNLGLLYYYQGKYSQAEPLYLRALAIKELQFGPDHPSTARSLNNLAALYRAQGKYERAEPLYRRTLAIREQQLGPEHPDTAIGLNNLAALLYSQEKYEQAEPLHQRALAIREQQLGPNHPHTAQSLANLARNYCAQGKYEVAEPLFLRSLTIREQQLGSQHPETANSLHWLAVIYQHKQQYEQAELLYQRTLAIREQQLGPQHLDTATTLYELATLYRTQDKYEQAELLYQRALAIREQALGPRHPWTRTIRRHYISFLRTMEREDEAKQMEKQDADVAPLEPVSADEIHTGADESSL